MSTLNKDSAVSEIVEVAYCYVCRRETNQTITKYMSGIIYYCSVCDTARSDEEE